MIRLNKYIASSGVSSRRAADQLILEGRVAVNGKTVTEPGTQIKEDNDTVTVDKVRVKAVSSYTYIMFNKPKGVVTTAKDELNRKTVFDYVKTDKRLFTVGRLDYDSEGLLILTNDGDLTQSLTHPKNMIAKHYVVKIEGEISESDLAILRKGVTVDNVKYNRCKVELLSFENGLSRLSVSIFEGKNREIRKMFSAVEKNVVFLKRVAIENLRLGGVSRGAWRYLNDEEIAYLKSLVVIDKNN